MDAFLHAADRSADSANTFIDSADTSAGLRNRSADLANAFLDWVDALADWRNRSADLNDAFIDVAGAFVPLRNRFIDSANAFIDWADAFIDWADAFARMRAAVLASAAPFLAWRDVSSPLYAAFRLQELPAGSGGLPGGGAGGRLPAIRPMASTFTSDFAMKLRATALSPWARSLGVPRATIWPSTSKIA